jgi:hypothetical protein
MAGKNPFCQLLKHVNGCSVAGGFQIAGDAEDFYIFKGTVSSD